MLIEGTSLDLWDTLTYLDRLILYPKSQKQAPLGFLVGGNMISLVRGKRPEAPQSCDPWPVSRGCSILGLMDAPDKGLASTESALLTELSAVWKLTAAFLPPTRLKQKEPEPHSASSGASGLMRRPLPTPFQTFSPIMLWQMYCLPWTPGQNLRKVVLPPHLEDSFRVPNSFIGVLRDLQACLLPSLFSLEVLLGDFSGLKFNTCVLSFVSLCIISLNRIICIIQIIPCYHSLKFFQLAFLVSWVHLGNFGHFYLV